MAVLHVDRQTPVSAGYLNQHPYCVAGTLGVQVKYASWIRYNGASWEVVAGTAASGIVTGNLTWGSPQANAINVAIGSWTIIPAFFISPVGGGYIVTLENLTTTTVAIGFRDYAGSLTTTQNTSMNFSLLIIGT